MGAKLIKRRRRLKLHVLAMFIFIVAFPAFLISSLFLRSYNNGLSISIQSNKDKIVALTVENDDLKVQIQSLSTKDRVMTFASEAGLLLNQNSIVSISAGE
ncbi:hypothetical protein EII25_04565 [Erysipelotrichaceae bacterium OH741_COT-311]|nr:hypothetical protein EII25_04565 [Erysipelotrichaceae bacterium OH741_COT-311]